MIKKLKMRFVLVNMLILTFVLFATLSSIYLMMTNSEIRNSNEIMDTLLENRRKNAPDMRKGHDRGDRPGTEHREKEVNSEGLSFKTDGGIKLVRLADMEPYSEMQEGQPGQPQDPWQGGWEPWQGGWDPWANPWGNQWGWAPPTWDPGYNPWENPPWPGWPNWPPAEETPSEDPGSQSAGQPSEQPADPPSSTEPEKSEKPETQAKPVVPSCTPAPHEEPAVPAASEEPATDTTEATESTEAETTAAPKPTPAPTPPEKPSEPPQRYDGNLVRSHIFADISENGDVTELSLQNFFRYEDDTIEDEAAYTVKLTEQIREILKSGNQTGKCTVDTVYFRYKIAEAGPEDIKTMVLLDRSIEMSTIHRLVISFIIIGCIGIVVVFILSLFLARWAIKPIEVAWNRQKQFIADASHELKTPLTVIATNTDVILSTPNDRIRDQERWLKYIKSETARMSKLVTELLYIAKSDSNEIRMEMSDFDISNAVSGVCLNFEAHAFEEQRELVADISPRLKYFGDEDRIKQLVTILVDNAIKYSIIGSQISVSLFRNNQNRIKLCVSNKCETLTDENVSKLFDRFYRVDSSRNSGTGGNGLGLNIAQTIAEAHNGSVTVNYNHGIISFVVTL